MRNYFIITTLLLACCQNTDIETAFLRKVFTIGCDSVYRADCGKTDYYYVYHYKDKDSTLILTEFEKMVPDTQYWQHSLWFFKYYRGLPDTADLNKETLLDASYDLKDEPGSGKHTSHLLYIFSYLKSYYSTGKQFPAHYSISSFEDGREKRRWFLKDSSTNKFTEVDYYAVHPLPYK